MYKFKNLLAKHSVEVATVMTPIVMLILLVLFTPNVNATEVTLDDLHIEVKKAIGTNRTPLMGDYEKKGEVNLGLEYSYGMFYNKFKVTSYFGHQFRHVSLGVESGVKWKKLDVYLDHYSGHAMDYNYGYKYPNENSIGIRFNFVRKVK